MPTPAAEQALSILRDPSRFQWHVIPLFAFVVYAYASEMEKGNWSGVFAGLAYWLMDVLWEVLNALIFHFTNHSGLWVVSGGTAYLILIGLSIEISFMFAVAGIVYTKMLPKDKNLRILGIPNRWFFIVALSVFCAIVESLLVQTPYFHWGYAWWNFPLVALIGYAPFDYVSFKVFDSPRKTQFRVVSALAVADLLAVLVFGPLLKWI